MSTTVDRPLSRGFSAYPRRIVSHWSSFSEWPGLAISLVVGLAYFALAQYVIWLNDPVRAGAGYWPAGGVTLAALLLLPARRWGWVVAAIVVAEIGGDALHGYPLAASSFWAAGNAAEPLIAALFLRRVGGGRLTPLPALGLFIVGGVVLGPLVGAGIGSIGTASVYGVSQVDVFLKWWVGDGLGVLVVAPLLLSLRERPVLVRSPTEFTSTLVALGVVAALLFRDWGREWDAFLPYLVLPALLWASVRVGIRGAAIGGFLIAEIANLATALGYGPLPAISDPALHGITSLQVFLGATLVSGLVVAVLVRDTVSAARDSERQESIAEAFQLAALPSWLPEIPGLSIAVGYQTAPGAPTSHVGGDWYDVFPVPDGSTGFVIGDVTGHDLASAALMSQVRNGIRSLLIEFRDPGRALTAMNDQLASNPNLELASAIVALYRDGHLIWANAGHPPLLLAPAGRPVEYSTARTGPILGIEGSRYQSHTIPLEPGDLVVGYTDGVMEHRTRPFDDGLAHLRNLVADSRDRETQALCQLLLEDGVGNLLREDDACVLALRRTLEDGASQPIGSPRISRGERPRVEGLES